MMNWQNIDIKLFPQNKWLFLLLIISFTISSCKIFRKNKSSIDSHTHKVETKSAKSSKVTKTKNFTQANELINLARNYMGVPYKFGGVDEEGMDCSGLIYTVCQNIGFSMPRISYKQAEIGEEIEMDNLQIGDLVFFRTAKSNNQISHVGLVTEISQPQSILFIHSSTSKGVREDNLFSDYWKKAFAKATRPFVF
ncbi:MAG: C40 family peptidase [Bacteroidota bacterium]